VFVVFRLFLLQIIRKKKYILGIFALALALNGNSSSCAQHLKNICTHAQLRNLRSRSALKSHYIIVFSGIYETKI